MSCIVKRNIEMFRECILTTLQNYGILINVNG